MAMITVEIWDATGNRRQHVEMPDDAPINRVIAVLIDKMRFPQNAPDGQPLSYKLHHRASGKQLLETQCLADVGAKEGDVLRLQPEITAGAGGCAMCGWGFGYEADSKSEISRCNDGTLARRVYIRNHAIFHSP